MNCKTSKTIVAMLAFQNHERRACAAKNGVSQLSKEIMRDDDGIHMRRYRHMMLILIQNTLR